jgi:hypothetical protein
MNLDRTPGVPHKGWQLDDVIDLRLDKGRHYGEYAICEFCGKEQIRFVHLLSHVAYPTAIRVGCVCCERLTEDYITPRQRESQLRTRAARRERWLDGIWKISRKGNEYRKTRDGHHVVVFSVGRGRFKCRIDGVLGTLVYDSSNEAKVRIFDVLEKRRMVNKEKTP